MFDDHRFDGVDASLLPVGPPRVSVDLLSERGELAAEPSVVSSSALSADVSGGVEWQVIDGVRVAH